MSAKTKIALVLGLLTAMSLVIWALSDGEDKTVNSSAKPFVSSNWNKAYLEADKHPGGLYLFNLLLGAHIDSTEQITALQSAENLDSLLSNDQNDKTFLFIGNSFGLQDSELDSILRCVEAGSDVFWAYNGMTENMLDRLFNNYEEQFHYIEKINIYLKGRGYSMYHIYQNDTIARNWWAFSPDLNAKDSMIAHASFMELDNLIELKHGKGSMFMTTNPELFQNVQVKRADGSKYAQQLIKMLPKDQSVYYLEFARLSDNYGNYDVDEQDGGEGKRETSYLKVIFENKTLLKAFLFGILGVLIFLIFRSKRMRPEVPYMEPKKDMTKAFMETITSIYFSKRNPHGMLNLQRRNFYAMVQKHFFIDLNRREDDRPLLALSEKSDVDINEIRRLIGVLEAKEATNVSDETIVNVHKWKNDFYLKTGIIKQHVILKEERREIVIERQLLLAMLLLVLGFAAIFGGFYLLVAAKGIGIALWPIGALVLAIGIRQIRRPILLIDDEKICYTPGFGKMKLFERADVIRMEWDEQTLLIQFTEQRTLRINQSEVSRYDRPKLKRLIQQFKTHELW